MNNWRIISLNSTQNSHQLLGSTVSAEPKVGTGTKLMRSTLPAEQLALPTEDKQRGQPPEGPAGSGEVP